ncbi:MAG TPA: type II CRISPR-associated endonuclease Cas1 [Phycisphaerae bacterium]|jgi:CRISPR-associated protein Cas1|nr:type II CRISPR-associated endonuclease Cas1 [Phycisphaerae bacterium]HOB76144.1 type II CRISPR-associated endonuclease Cas1 [Phycisphaerae bacterium]HOJ56188.1 type II CRISPR-associated endonuclease Cas1 [Phycisphaerae bacterium]HOL28248.1 type II CRISPR-associated endonuclease Cas1 [Phycisphaerae bacterium]HPP22630.1 type II CRISPR-associated endonuclease Cas1 [Phycisphaerae bacterium]
MIKRTIEISREPAHLAVRLDQLHIQRNVRDEWNYTSIPCEDIGVLLVDHPQVTYSHYALARLMEFGAAVVVCGRNHLPVGMLMPLSSHTEVVWRLQDQLSVSKPLKKQLWRQLVVAKIRAQAANLEDKTPARSKLLALAREVRSGDASNVEAQAAKVYWSAWLGDSGPEGGFRRDPDGDGINALLNYGYAVLRAAVARALVSAGLLPALGIHHSNRSNAFCLADDLVEPLRPMADAQVRELYRQGHTELGQPTKAKLLALLTQEVLAGEQRGPLMVALHRMAASLVACYRGEARQLLIPTATGEAIL